MSVVPCGECFRWAVKDAAAHGGIVVHGIVTSPLSDPPHRYEHAWVERDGIVYDWQTMESQHGGKFSGRGYPVEVFDKLYVPKRIVEYTAGEVLNRAHRSGHYGPWDPRVKRNGNTGRILRPAIERAWPWDGHTRRLVDLDDAALLGFVERDREHWLEAKEHPVATAHKVIDERIFFRNGAPRVGEPIWRQPKDVKPDWKSMYCGRGTGHLGTGLYFFGTLRAAVREAPTLLGAMTKGPQELAGDVAKLRERLGDVYVVDMEHVPDAAIFRVSSRSATDKLHEFAKNLLCWPDAMEEVDRWRAQLAKVDTVLADVDPGSDEWYEARDEQRAVRKSLVGAKSALRSANLRLQFDGPRLDLFDENGSDGPPPLAAAAIEPYLRDLREGRWPGYHPMTYYMGNQGYSAVVHVDWKEFNSGDIGNIWYPFAES